MASTSLVNELVPVNLPLSAIYLDPNNPRFTGQDWVYVSDDEIASEAIQDDTRRHLVKDFGVEKLRMNMEVNGFLPIDRVIVREFSQGKYVVLEGNRRICAAKLISQYSSDGTEISQEVMNSLALIPCLQYVGSERNAAWVFQGLRHITGINDWSAFNKAKLLVEQMEDEELGLTDVGKRFGLSPFGAGQWVRGYYAFKQAREESDFINEVDERSYPYFQELFSRSSNATREWMEWDDEEKKFKNGLNFNEFVSWIYPRTPGDGDIMGEDDEVNSDQRGDFDKRPLRRTQDIRQLSFLIRESKESFEKFRRDKDIERAYSEAMTKKYEKEVRDTHDPGEEVFRTVRECVKAINDVPYRLLRVPETKGLLYNLLDELLNAINNLRN